MPLPGRAQGSRHTAATSTGSQAARTRPAAWRAIPPKLLAGFDVVVVPSRRDMRTLVTIEAMAAGAAVIVSDATAVWGPGDLIQDGVTGFVYRSGEPTMLAGQLGRLLQDRLLLDRLRRRGAEQAEGFGPAAFARTTKDAVQMCLGAGRGRGQGGTSR
jgi:glycosyltransferase involved in cell wall biosynthesis